MNFNQGTTGNEKSMQMEQYFLKNQNRWYTGAHNLITEDHPVHFVSIDDTFFKPPIDEEATDTKTLDSFFTDKLELNKLHIDSLLSQIYRRHEIKKENLYRIDKDMMKCQSQLFEIEHIPKWYSANITRTRTTLEKEILTLEKEKRDEYVSWWRDLVLVKRDLINALKEFKSSENRHNLVIGLDSGPETESIYVIPHHDYHS